MLAALRRRLAAHPVVQRVLANSGWLLAERLIGVIGNLLIGGWVARYLGPQQFGTLNYVLALTALVMPLIGLGLSQIVTRDMVREPARAAELLGTALLLRILAAVVLLPLAGLGFMLFPDNGPLAALIWIALLGVTAQVLQEAPADLFRAQLAARSLAQAAVLSQLFVLLLRLVLIVTTAPLAWFVWAVTLQFTAALLATLILAAQRVPLRQWRWQAQRARQLLRDSWPLMLAGVAVLVSMKVDQLLLQWLIGGPLLGYYAAAVRISELCYLLPVAVATSLLPRLVAAQRGSPAAQAAQLQLLFDLQMLLAYMMLPAALVAAPLMLELVFGAAYRAAQPMLLVHLMSLVFVASGVLRAQWLTVVNRPMFALAATLCGVVVNLSLNLWWIPVAGGVGAAAATVASQAVASWLSSRLLPDAGVLWRSQTRALAAPLRLPTIIAAVRQRQWEQNG